MKSKSFEEAKFVTEVRSWKAIIHDLAGAICSEMVAVGAAVEIAAELPDDAASANDFEKIAKNEEAGF